MGIIPETDEEILAQILSAPGDRLSFSPQVYWLYDRAMRPERYKGEGTVIKEDDRG